MSHWRSHRCWCVTVAAASTLAACGPGDPDAIALSYDELAAGIEVASIDDPGDLVLFAEAFAIDDGPPSGEIAVDRDPGDPRFDVVLSYRTGGCPALPQLTADVDGDVLRVNVEIMSTGEPDCPAMEYVEAIRIDLAPEAESLPIATAFG